MSASVSKNGKISFQGAPGAYSEIACREVFPDAEPLPCATFEDAFAAVQTGAADLAMIPVDNTLAGRVADVHHLMPKSGLSIIGEHFLKIEHALLGVKGAQLDILTDVHSHLHALPQCRKVIRELGLTPHVHGDTAGAAAEVAAKGDPAHGAIASRRAGEIYGLDVLRADVQDEGHNTTRFLVLSRAAAAPAFDPALDYVTSIVFQVRDIPASLYKALGGFATNGVNMMKIESYVNPQFQVAQFLLDVAGHEQAPALARALDELRFFATDVAVLGTYPAHAFRRGGESNERL